MTQLQRFLPLVVIGAAVVVLAIAASPAGESPDDFQLEEFGKVPVVEGGRVKPLDTVARVNLMAISGGRQEFKDDKGKTQSAVRWLLDVMTSGPIFQDAPEGKQYAFAGRKDRVFRIDNDQLLKMLGLQPREGFRYAIDEFADKTPALFQLAAEADEKEAKDRDVLQTKAMELVGHLKIYMKLSRFEHLAAIPAGDKAEDWEPIAVRFSAKSGDKTGARLWVTMLEAYARGDAGTFNTSLAEYETWLAKQPGAVLAEKASMESGFNHFAPFFWCQWLYVLVVALCCLSWLFWREPLQRSAFWLAVFVLTVHTFALFTRMYLQGRPPVTNLYSSAVFIGWGSVALGLALDLFFRRSLGIGTLVAGVLGFLTMILAQYLAGSGDTMDVLVAVLDTNFWLSTHVTCVTFGYVATLVAALLGAVYIVTGLYTRTLSNPEDQRSLGKMIYGTVCFATLLSFVGTVLGGIWADQSWGRFWGWDPKENGALLIVIMNALILHARWAGVVKSRGVAMLAVAGAMVTIWSWFGTNQLGVGLHAYGFNKALVIMCNVVWGTCLVLLSMGAVPLRYWRSFAPTAKAAPQDQGVAPPPKQKRQGMPAAAS